MNTKMAYFLSVVSLASCLLLPAIARADEGGERHDSSGPGTFAFGVMLGEPLGLSVKQYIGRHAWDLGIGVGPGVRVHADYLVTLIALFGEHSASALDLYAGLGPLVGVYSGWCGRLYDTGRSCGDGGVFGGGRVPVGVDLRLPLPIDLAIEAAPGFAFARGGAFFLIDAALYVRLLF